MMNDNKTSFLLAYIMYWSYIWLQDAGKRVVETRDNSRSDSSYVEVEVEVKVNVEV
jgi:hypothetical protein